jgi:hypothetical protein
MGWSGCGSVPMICVSCSFLIHQKAAEEDGVTWELAGTGIKRLSIIIKR